MEALLLRGDPALPLSPYVPRAAVEAVLHLRQMFRDRPELAVALIDDLLIEAIKAKLAQMPNPITGRPI